MNNRIPRIITLKLEPNTQNLIPDTINFLYFAPAMSLYITSLASGSNGNCYYVGNEREAVLIDAGITCRETECRLGRLGLSMRKIRAIFISHEHTDHIRDSEDLF